MNIRNIFLYLFSFIIILGIEYIFVNNMKNKYIEKELKNITEQKSMLYNSIIKEFEEDSIHIVR
ncbi:MAG: hypothetical protein JXQ66_06950, partial [Campylobacterales bacterium]|nr:hypothetical protein [Campylobacterales bacterium]